MAVKTLRPLQRSIYVNRNLRMDTIKAIGFDMDYTLVRYKKNALEELAHRLTIEKLIQRGYPQEIQAFKYDPNFVIRGLSVDKQLGNILKLDRHNHVSRAFHGRTSLPKKERRELYRLKKFDFKPPRFAIVDTQFALPEMSLYADLIDYFEKNPNGFDFWKIFTDIRECIDEAHRDDTLKSIVKNDLETYIEKDDMLEVTLKRFVNANKKLFLLTNSLLDYTKVVMDYILGENVWQQYFDVIIVGADKPRFFINNEPFALLNNEGKVVERPATLLEKNNYYQAGHTLALEQALGIFGEEILYVGDHIYGDILKTKKTGLWRTALIVEEIEEEITNTLKHVGDLKLLIELENERRQLDELLIEKPNDSTTQSRLSQILKTIHDIEDKIDQAFNQHFGMLLKEMPENSKFASQIEDYACIYTSRVSNFSYYSALQYFKSPRDFMPHEYEIFKD